MEEKIKIICLGSGSDGNCYLFVKHNQIVIVECGLEYEIICRKLILQGFLPNQVVSVICTHYHSDHTKGIIGFGKNGAVLHLPTEVDSDGDVKDKAKITLTDWLKVYCFKVNHDCDAYGFAFLDTENKESYLFINDTSTFEFPKELKNIKFDGIFIECNYIQTQLDAIRRTAKNKFKYDRQERAHLSLLGTKQMLSQMNLINTKAIVLMHLSMDCANETAMKTEIESTFKIRCMIAKRQGGIM